MRKKKENQNNLNPLTRTVKTKGQRSKLTEKQKPQQKSHPNHEIIRRKIDTSVENYKSLNLRRRSLQNLRSHYSISGAMLVK